ncbi:bifunctional phosphopantothenoylcysteine decarboxylase/phosphopantothenate--cysteine ligase CoaBC [Lentilitoribacter sp. EG35]|uniref:bifunctional phosphopantothenoylcysteine decarboxylase/phosphopantothenate--cysteine ligase CoaBC n=1 Tax=Lentilitoribacter sp. EG35 TaxID=3234192 RepID=UPI003B9698A8
MASLTIRNLDPEIKQKLREQAAANGRSMEEEMRLLLAGLDGSAGEPTISVSSPMPTPSNVHDMPALDGKRVLLIITGGIAAYKSLNLIRRLRERGVSVRPVMTNGAQEFITPLSVGALAADHVYTELFSREDEQDVGHIRLARDCDLVLVAPATANIMAKMANGIADDLASTILLATNKPILIAPAMNPQMWMNKATQRNLMALKQGGVHVIEPEAGEMAESGETGKGRLADELSIAMAANELLDDRPQPLLGKTAIVTSGPTHEPIDPVRYIANRSSGKQGHAIAAALARAGAKVKLISGPVDIPDPYGVDVVRVERAEEMLDVVEQLLPVDIAIMVAAVADWRVKGEAGEKIKKQKGKSVPNFELVENPDILKTVGHHKQRPEIVVGFAAETQNLVDNATSKLKRKGADLIVANDVSPETGIMGGDRNRVKIISKDNVQDWPDLSKKQVANRLVEHIALELAEIAV